MCKAELANASCKQTYSTTGLANSAQNQSVHNVEIYTAEETFSRVQIFRIYFDLTLHE